MTADSSQAQIPVSTVQPLPPENWTETQTILVILAHPDDPDFFCGATISRWVRLGHTVHYCLLTRGDKGVRDEIVDPVDLARTREGEQRRAADALGVKELVFLDYFDGYLVPTLDARRDVARQIRRFRPDVVVTSDPTQIFGDNSINHPDHRYVGQIVVDAFFPAAGNPLYFPELLQEEGLEPFAPKELWLTVTGNPNTVVDVTAYWEDKIRALHNHATQIGDMSKLDERMRGRHTPDSTLEAPRYEDRFRRFIFR